MLREAHRVQVYHSQRDGLSVGQSSSSVSERAVRPVGERTGRPVGPIGQELNVANAQVRILLDRQKERILAECQAEIKKHEFQADYDSRKLGEIIESQQEELRCAQAEELQRRDQQLLDERLLQQNSELREAHQKSLNEMDELKKFQGSTFDTIARRRLVEDQDTILELTGMNDSKDFQDAESIRIGNSHVTSRPVSFPPHPIPERMLRHSFGVRSRREGPSSIWDTHGISRNVFVNRDASSAAPYPQELNPWSSITEGPLHSSTVEKSERRTQDQDQRCQSGPSAESSVVPSEGDSSKNYGADQQRLQISDLHFEKFPTPATFACWEIRFKTEVCTFSQFPTEAMHWIKEVELVDSVDDLRSSSSTRGIQMPNFEVLDAKIASALNRIIHNTQFKRKVTLEEMKAQKEDRFFRGRQIADLMYEYFRVTGTTDSVENYADLFTNALRNDDIQEFDKMGCTLLSMTQIPSDDILESLYKLRIRESEKLKTVLEL